MNYEVIRMRWLEECLLCGWRHAHGEGKDQLWSRICRQDTSAAENRWLIQVWRQESYDIFRIWLLLSDCCYSLLFYLLVNELANSIIRYLFGCCKLELKRYVEQPYYMSKPPVFVMKTGGFGPSGETRTRGILIPNRVIIFFLTFLAPFSGLYSGNSSFPELFIPLFPGVRILSMVKYVVKSKHSPKGNTFRGVFSCSEVWWL